MSVSKELAMDVCFNIPPGTARVVLNGKCRQYLSYARTRHLIDEISRKSCSACNRWKRQGSRQLIVSNFYNEILKNIHLFYSGEAQRYSGMAECVEV